ncbi:GNAT family N-acetyltransferase [Roseibium algae]|uniref:GNAT family N-acetyltransferase n=1 Tax=Roseibium algae TaxID=3123038 RepID=A0ABU8THJ9_9HYPH
MKQKAEPVTPCAAEYECIVHTSPSFLQMKALWRRMPGGAVSTPFQTPGFLSAFQTHLGADVDGYFAIYEFRCHAERLPKILLPVFVRRRGPVRIASMPDLGMADMSGPILARSDKLTPDAVQGIWKLFLETLTGVDVLDIYNIPETIAGLENPLVYISNAEPLEPYFELDLLDPKLVTVWRKKSVFKEATRKLRKLRERGVDFFVAETLEDRLLVCSKLISQKKARFAASGLENNLSSRVVADFYQELAAIKAPDSPAIIFGLRDENEIVASAMTLSVEGCMNGVLLSIAGEEWHRLSPGVVLLTAIIDWAQQNDFKTLNFGTGLQSYKTRFGGDMRQTYLISQGITPVGHAYCHVRPFIRTIKQLPRRK